MLIFFDTNILPDIVTQRSPHYASSQSVLDACDLLDADVVIAWHTLATTFYIVAKKEGRNKAAEILKDTLMAMTVVETGQAAALRAFELNFTDLEDAMQAAAAETALADFIITRDSAGFSESTVPAVTPEEFIARFSGNP